jgi:hypothetical protein
VTVGVKDRLAGKFAGIEGESEVTRREFCCHAASELHQVDEGFRVVVC